MSLRIALPLAVIGLAAAACSASNGYYAPRGQAAYAVDPPSYQKSNVYSSRADYERNYQGIHNGPERTGP